MKFKTLILNYLSFFVNYFLLCKAPKATFNFQGFREIKLNYEEKLKSQEDTTGMNEWSYIMSPGMKRCHFRQIIVLCDDETPTASTNCQANCQLRGYELGICYSEPGPGNQPSGEWTKSRGRLFCYCGNCLNDKCKEYCYNFGFATGYCHQSTNYGSRCKCVGCDPSICSKYCNNIYGFALDQSFCHNNQCNCLAKSCD